MDSLDQDMQKQFSLERIMAEQQQFITRVYGWMSVALVITGITAYLTATTMLWQYIFTSGIFIGLIIGELLLVMVLSWAINKMSAAVATFVFILYSVLNGLTLSCIFLIYTQSSIAQTFFV